MKPVKLTSEWIDKLVADFRDALKTVNLADGQLNYTRNFTLDSETKAKLIFTPTAWIKMWALIDGYSSEVAWHGLITRVSETEYRVNDILVYPQMVTGVTVETDQEEYQRWIMALDDPTFNALRLQGHSHVNMSTHPSGVDLTHQAAILRQLTDEDFYVFVIWNKRGEHMVKIYDLKANRLYEDSDIDVEVSGLDLDTFVDVAKSAVRAAPTLTKPAQPEKKKKSKVSTVADFYGADTDFDREIFGTFPGRYW